MDKGLSANVKAAKGSGGAEEQGGANARCATVTVAACMHALVLALLVPHPSALLQLRPGSCEYPWECPGASGVVWCVQDVRRGAKGRAAEPRAAEASGARAVMCREKALLPAVAPPLAVLLRHCRDVYTLQCKQYILPTYLLLVTSVLYSYPGFIVYTLRYTFYSIYTERAGNGIT